FFRAEDSIRDFHVTGVQTCALPISSRRRKDAPALSSPPNPYEPLSKPSTNHLKPTGTSASGRPIFAATRSIIELETSVFPTAASAGHPSRCWNRYQTATDR